MDDKVQSFKRFDQVRILTTKNVKYLSAPPGTPASPDGLWSVVCAVGDNDLLLVKNNVIVRIPIGDVLKVIAYDLDAMLSRLGRLSHHVEKRRPQGQETTSEDDTGSQKVD